MNRELAALSLIVFLSAVTFATQLVFPQPPQVMRVHNLDTGLNYATIQEAIDASETLDGHTILVESGTYYENVIVHKSLFILGEENSKTIIDGKGEGNVLTITADRVVVAGFTIRNSGTYPYCGVYVSSSYNNITHNVVTKNYSGIRVNASSHNVISWNNITENAYYGVEFRYSDNNILSENNITKNESMGIYLYESSNNTISRNEITEDNYGVLILGLSRNNIVVKNNITQNNSGVKLWLSSSSNFVCDNRIKNNINGVWIYGACNNTVSRNIIIRNSASGIGFEECSGNVAFENNIRENGCGVWVMWGFNNTVYHNNFVNNTEQTHIYTYGYVNFWDNGLEGNYWSNYTGADTDYDGIGDSVYKIDENNADYHPLMGLFHAFDAADVAKVGVISNSTVERFEYLEFNSTIRLVVSNMTMCQTYGFCRVCIPHVLMDVSHITVIIDGGAVTPLHFDNMTYDNGTHRWIYFAYSHSRHRIAIIPEFPPSSASVMLFIAASLVTAVYKRNAVRSRCEAKTWSKNFIEGSGKEKQ